MPGSSVTSAEIQIWSRGFPGCPGAGVVEICLRVGLDGGSEEKAPGKKKTLSFNTSEPGILISVLSVHRLRTREERRGVPCGPPPRTSNTSSTTHFKLWTRLRRLAHVSLETPQFCVPLGSRARLGEPDGARSRITSFRNLPLCRRRNKTPGPILPEPRSPGRNAAGPGESPPGTRSGAHVGEGLLLPAGVASLITV